MLLMKNAGNTVSETLPMPRTGWKKPESDRRLSDLVSVGVMTTVFAPGVVDEVIAACGRTEKRRRSLPTRSMAYFATGMALHSDGSYENVLAVISDGFAWADRAEHSPKLARRAARVRRCPARTITAP
ncbi:hypothetical protein E3N85_09540 [Cryobacterium sp. Hz9]|nr:hypothetical protein E3N85_09540 [Cryobacterium sp. Hz9]